MTTIEYEQFDQYMKGSKSRYHAQLFQEDIMYFCKLWKSHRQSFATFCKAHECLTSYLTLNQRCVDYEMSVLEYRMSKGQIQQETFRQQASIIQRVFLS